MHLGTSATTTTIAACTEGPSTSAATDGPRAGVPSLRGSGRLSVIRGWLTEPMEYRELQPGEDFAADPKGTGLHLPPRTCSERLFEANAPSPYLSRVVSEAMGERHLHAVPDLQHPGLID